MDIKQRSVTRAVWQAGRLSRSELGKRTGLTPNGVGLVADALLRRGILRECPPEPGIGAGRPRVPLEIDPSTMHVVGLAIGPGQVEVSRVGLGGRLLSRPAGKAVTHPERLVDSAAQLLATALSPQTLGVGVSVTGFVDPVDRAILFSSAQPGRGRVSLAPVFAAAKSLPVVLENDMHALAARWLLGQRAEPAQQDVLLVSIADGRLGAAMLIDGRPNRGCVTGASELGHARFLIDTERCYCGHRGCLERIVSSDFLSRGSARPGRRQPRRRTGAAATPPTLGHRIAQYASAAQIDDALETMLAYLACGIGNATNFVRPHRLVLLSGLGSNGGFDAALVRKVRGQLLAELVDHVRIEVLGETTAGSAESAAWLSIADLLHGGWGRVENARNGFVIADAL